jgi:S1-C subfamily serine protease
MIKTILATLLALFSFDIKAETIHPSSVAEYASTVVMILNKEETGGGTGVIYHSTAKHSFVLTNNHICNAVQHGGVVLKNEARYMVRGYKPSAVHDLCMLYVDGDLGVDTEIANTAPDLYSKATVVGFPHLAPETVVQGHFSKEHIISIQTGSRPCTDEEVEQLGLQCLFGGFPIVHKYEAQFVSATILPGNSGSPVYNDDGEIAGMVFASDSRELAYAEIVPQEYVKNFVQEELQNLMWKPTIAIKNSKKTDRSSKKQHIYIQPIYNIGE